ncbi:MAG: type II/IV secretion system protein [Candidatus Pacebacteria bacterium]|nr:type II/IV secretion system protein [Candidatus Paceibacterota bacterium]
MSFFSKKSSVKIEEDRVLTQEENVKKFLSQSQGQEKDKTVETVKTQAENQEQVSIIRIVDHLVLNAFNSGASDIHIDPEEHQIRVRFRIDGILHDQYTFPKDVHSEIITRVKILSGLRTDEHQKPQDGRFKVPLNEKKNEFVDVRVSIAPTYYGENCVMRLLAETTMIFSLENLGFSPENAAKIYKAIKKPYGMILATGPTGSGKSSTLYAILKKLNTKEISIITVEDPIEYSISGIDQIQVNATTGLTFAQGLRFILRQDPNIIMVGEIRDAETAGIAINASMTGHLLLSTLHTNDAITTLPRIFDMGIEPFLVASTMSIAIGQRLVRTICKDCKVERTLADKEIESVTDENIAKFLRKNKDLSVGVGCKKCDMSGFKGRIGIQEVLEINEEIRELIMKRASTADIKAAAIRNGMKMMAEDGLDKVRQGLTTIEEVLRVFSE